MIEYKLFVYLTVSLVIGKFTVLTKCSDSCSDTDIRVVPCRPS